MRESYGIESLYAYVVIFEIHQTASVSATRLEIIQIGSKNKHTRRDRERLNQIG